MRNNTLTIVISHLYFYRGIAASNSPQLSVANLSLPRLRFSSHRGEFATITFGKDKVLLRANGSIVSSSTVSSQSECI